MVDSQILDIISHEFKSNDVLVEKSTVSDVNTKSQLIVYQSQEALFVKEGEALDLFGPGRYSLETENIPLLRKFISKIFKTSKTPFSSDIYFFNLVNVLDVLWGTDSPIMCEDGKYHIFVSVRANGQMGVKVSDSRKFFNKIVGQLQVFDIAALKKSIKGLLLSIVKDQIAKVMITEGISFLEVATRMREISGAIHQELNEEASAFGISIVNFFVNDISVFPDDYALLKAKKEELASKYQELDFETAKEVRLAEAKAKARAVQGYSYQEERKYDVLEGAAKNEGNVSSSIMGVGIGLGMGAGIGETIKDSTMKINEEIKQQPHTKQCSKCATPNDINAKFCQNCGEKFTTANFCKNCQAKLSPDSKFCPECGTKVG